MMNYKEKKGVPKIKAKKSEMEMGIECETEEHSWLSPMDVKRLVRDHLKENPEYYTELEEFEHENEAHEAGESKAKEKAEHTEEKEED